jgi:hypothetical protein
MLRRRPKARTRVFRRAMAAVSKHEECTAAPILRDARTRLAHLRHRYRTRAPQDEAAQRIPNSRLVAEPFAVISNSRCQTAQIFSFPRRVFCARILSLNLHSPRTEGWAERRRAYLVVVVAPVKARVGRVCETRRASCKAYLTRSPLGAPPWLRPPAHSRVSGNPELGPRFRGDERKRVTPRPRSAFGSFPETPSTSGDANLSSIGTIRSQ